MSKSNGKLIYVASPYTYHPETPHCKAGPEIKEYVENRRYQQALQFTILLLERGHNVFSPIVYSHNIARISSVLAGEWEAWKAFDELMLSKSDCMIVLCIDGWDMSVGIRAEIEYAKTINLPIHFIHDIERDINAIVALCVE